MKVCTLFLALLVGYTAAAQWSNTTNLFYDSLHTPVCAATLNQVTPLVVQSFPDSGYFVIWQDARNDPANSKYNIYAQKYDKNGSPLWAQNGIPVTTGSNTKHYTFPSNTSYRNRSYAATDSAGGFYITYADDSVNTYVWERASVQHITSSGTAVFGTTGYILRTSTEANLNTQPQLIADGKGGFFVSFRSAADVLYAYCFKDVNGTLQSFGGGTMNETAVEVYANSPCGNYIYLNYPNARVLEYLMFPDGQGGCNMAMSLTVNGVAGPILAYNKLWRAKKNATATQAILGLNYEVTPVADTYQKDNVYRLYYLKTSHQEIRCGGSGSPVYVVNQYTLVQNGFQVIDGTANTYDFNFPNGVTVATAGNINTTILAACKRSYSATSGLSNFWVQGYAIKEEVYDSIPYQRTSTTNPLYPGYNTVEPPGANKLNFFRDSLLAQGVYASDFSLTGGSNQVFSAGLISDPDPSYTFKLAMRLQHLAVERQSADSFAVVYKTARKGGELIGKDQGDTRYGTEFDLPVVAVNKNGTGLFYVRDNYNPGVRVSPIFNGAQLSWGALGRQIGTGVNNGSYYNAYLPFTALDPLGGKALTAWMDDRNTSASGLDIVMRHLDSLNLPNYYPPVKRVRLIPNPYTASSSLPASLYGVSKRYTLLETFAPYGDDKGITPVAEIKDDYYMGQVTARVFQNNGSIRTYNGKPYLDRNFTIYADSVAPAASFLIRLYFTKTEFNALKAADNSISTPADLVVMKQPHNSAPYPQSYTPVAGEQLLTPLAWDSVAGGYYVAVRTNSLGDFFIWKTGVAALCPGGSGSIVSNITGSSYQWQVNTGSGFVNLSNNANYSGVNTAVLQLNAVPSSWSGYQYQCTVGGATSVITTLRLINTWSGTVNNNWENAANWSCGTVPDANTDVVLTTGNVVVSSNAACRSLSLAPGVTVTVKPGFVLTVTH